MYTSLLHISFHWYIFSFHPGVFGFNSEFSFIFQTFLSVYIIFPCFDPYNFTSFLYFLSTDPTVTIFFLVCSNLYLYVPFFLLNLSPCTHSFIPRSTPSFASWHGPCIPLHVLFYSSHCIHFLLPCMFKFITISFSNSHSLLPRSNAFIHLLVRPAYCN